ncbi:MAG: hypothetical protein A2015_01640 [Spirochaetes bacterium GWF1_31_7]|nr:MAG: hypothetical protein A2Y30_03005 [Spirochaetes bacterium GWE1_32_154]OHD48302.1 MAG: hypothetical protein A2Y29_05520 [Spirochaetes bacterium GWE2_31_10]OHD49290.1 MAG: hypothetical protein A2015_01640 [Spirochaetes bacterium GWF1_31_7]OHD81145.1 MAG: hypothetical protein A2355_16580 [Spirochaetes bacterium RIFOXYB1_FULL_32_8]HBD92970.1 hypothetical protein [Spirochaetia bacterium]
MKKMFLMVIVLSNLLIAQLLNGTELRLSGMGGVDPYGGYLMPDVWVDSFYVNPATAVFSKENIIRIQSIFDLDPLKYNFTDDEIDVTITQDLKTGFLRNLKSIVIGYDCGLNIDYNYNTIQGMYKKGLDTKNDSLTLSLNNSLVMAAKINENSVIGYLATILYSYSDADSYYIDENDKNQAYSIKNTSPVVMEVNQKWSYLFNRGNYFFSIIFPLRVYYSLTFSDFLYPEENAEWEDGENKLSIYSGINFHYENTITKHTSLRFVSENSVMYHDEFTADELEDTDHLNSFGISVPILTSLSFIHTFDKFLFFYGFTFHTSPGVIFDYISPEDYSRGIYTNTEVYSSIGMEIAAFKKITVRAGVGFDLFNLRTSNYIDKYSTQTEPVSTDYIDISFPVNPEISIGMDIKTGKRLTIQLTNKFIYRDIYHSQNNYYYYNSEDLEYKKFDIAFQSSIGFLIGPAVKDNGL